jgi:hypothetical protein
VPSSHLSEADPPLDSRPSEPFRISFDGNVARYPLLGPPPGLGCVDAPNVRLFVERGLAVSEESRARFPGHSVFLDGVYDGPPFLDNKNRQYSLDHHAGCLRPFTLATCEQAALMVLQGLPLDEGEWRLFVNEPDLDSVLASWLLLNHRVLRADGFRLLRRAMPLVRVEGLIDSHGLEMDAFLGMPSRLVEAEKARIVQLRALETTLKATGEWETTEPAAYVRSVLGEIDEELLGTGIGRAVRHEQVRLSRRKLAVLCSSTEGIYEVETQLRQRYQDELGVVILDRGGGHMTIRQVDPFLPSDLRELYPLLNAQDPRVSAHSEDRWGGSNDIGGSPRIRGTGLTGIEVLRTVEQLYGTADSG